MKTGLMFEEYRGDILECLHFGTACVVNQNGIVAHVGDTEWPCYYRSASKPIQALPVLVRGLHKKYGLTEEETAIFSGSHYADEVHVRALESIMRKAELNEDDMVMLPTYPNRMERRQQLFANHMPPRRIYHNCSGKHLALMLLAREVGDDVRDYWRRDSRTQREVREMISIISGTPFDDIGVGVDGCGVPVFAVPFKNIAASYLRLACPELIEDDAIRAAALDNAARLHAYPHMIAGKDILDTIMTADNDVIAKNGAMGVFAVGIRSKGIGIAFKTIDGSHDEFADETIEALQQLGLSDELNDMIGAIRRVYSNRIVNDNKEVVGYRKPVFRLEQN